MHEVRRFRLARAVLSEVRAQTLCLLVGLIASATVAGAVTQPLVLEGTFPAAVSLEAANGQVNLVLDPSAVPAWYYVEDPSGRTTECAFQGDTLVCRAPEKGAQLRIDLVVAPGLEVRVEGTGLDLAAGPVEAEQTPEAELSLPDAEDRDDDPEEPGDKALEQLRQLRPNGGSYGPLSLTVASSQVYWSGTLAGTARMDASTLMLEDVAGKIDLHLVDTAVQAVELRANLTVAAEGGALEVRGGRGVVSLQGEETQCTLDGTTGQTAVNLRGGSVTSIDGNGQITIEAEGSSVRLDGGAHRQGWSVKGRDLVVSAGRLSGNGTVEIAGGSLDGEQLEALTLDLEAATATVRGAGDVGLQARSGADVTLANTGKVTAKIEGARFAVDSPAQLQLQANGASVQIRGVSRIGNWQLRDSQVELDLSGVEGRASLRLDGSSSAQIDLPTPCYIALKGRTTPLSQGLDVSGCEIQTPQQRRRVSRGGLQRLDGGRGVIFSIDLDPDATVRIVGRN